MEDIEVTELVRVFTFLDPCTDIEKRLSRWGKKQVTQKAHAMEWFTAQAQGLRIGRGEAQETDSVKSGRKVYNRVINPAMLLWIAVGFGAEEDAIEKTIAETAHLTKKTEMKECARIFRSHFPFDAIIQLYQHPAGWRYDPAMVDHLVFGPDGYVDEGKSDMRYVYNTMNREYNQRWG